MLHHLVDARILLLERRFDDTHHRVGITVVIVRTAGTLDHADVKPHYAARNGINLALGDLDVFLAHDVVAQLFQLHRQDARNELFGKHLEFGIVAVADLVVEIFQLLANQLVERIVVVQQIQVQDLVGNSRRFGDPGGHAVGNVTDALLRNPQRLEFGQVAQVLHELVHPDIQVQFRKLNSGNLLETLPGYADDLLAARFETLLLERQVEVQQDFADILFQDRIQSFQLGFVEFGVPGRVDRQDFHLAIREQQVLHLDQDLAHHVLLLGIIQHVVIRLESPLVGDILQDHSLAVTRADRIEIEVGQRRNPLVHLRQQVFIDLREGRAFDEFEHVLATADDIAVQFDHRIGRATDRRDRHAAAFGRSMVQRSYVADLQRRRFVLFVFARQFVIRNHAVDKVLILRITENALQQIGRFDLLVGDIVAGIGEPDPILDENGERILDLGGKHLHPLLPGRNVTAQRKAYHAGRIRNRSDPPVTGQRLAE